MSYDKEKLDEILNKAHQDIENARRNDGIINEKPALNLNPPGYTSPQKKQFATGKEIDDKVADIKADAMKEADGLFENLSPEEKKTARDAVRTNLFPEDPKPGIGEQKRDVNQSQEQMNALSSKYVRDKEEAGISSQKTPEQSTPSEPKPQEPAPEVPPEGKGQTRQPTRYEQSLSSFKSNQEEVTQDKDLRRNFTKSGKDISEAEAKKDEEKKDDKDDQEEKEQPDKKDQPDMDEQQEAAQPVMENESSDAQHSSSEGGRYMASLSSERQGQEKDTPEASKTQETRDSVSMDDRD